MTTMFGASKAWTEADWQQVQAIAETIMARRQTTAVLRSHELAMYLYFRSRGRR